MQVVFPIATARSFAEQSVEGRVVGGEVKLRGHVLEAGTYLVGAEIAYRAFVGVSDIVIGVEIAALYGETEVL